MLRLLLVEDNQLSQKMMFYTFKKANIVADFAEDGMQAQKMARATFYDVILMDVMMPNMDGYESTQLIRQNEKTSGKRSLIIGLSGNVYDNEREKCISAGMDDFIVKPFEIETFKNVLAHHGVPFILSDK